MAVSGQYFVTDLVKEVGSLPSVAAQIVSLVTSADCDMKTLTRVINSDAVMTMRFLSLANSAAHSGGREIKGLRDALVLLGLRRVRNVALCMAMHDMVPAKSSDDCFDMTGFWKHNLATASCAQELALKLGKSSPDNAWLAGILHGLGIAALHQKTGADFHTAVKLATEQKITLA